MSPEFQINNNMIGNRILYHAEFAHAVSNDQEGNCEGHTANMTSLSKCLLVDLIFQKQKVAAVAMNDNNCISHLIVILVLMSYDLPQKVVHVLIETLPKAVIRFWLLWSNV